MARGRSLIILLQSRPVSAKSTRRDAGGVATSAPDCERWQMGYQRKQTMDVMVSRREGVVVGGPLNQSGQGSAGPAPAMRHKSQDYVPYIEQDGVEIGNSFKCRFLVWKLPRDTRRWLFFPRLTSFSSLR
jgi:hypothetical protein